MEVILQASVCRHDRLLDPRRVGADAVGSRNAALASANTTPNVIIGVEYLVAGIRREQLDQALALLIEVLAQRMRELSTGDVQPPMRGSVS